MIGNQNNMNTHQYENNMNTHQQNTSTPTTSDASSGTWSDFGSRNEINSANSNIDFNSLPKDPNNENSVVDAAGNTYVKRDDGTVHLFRAEANGGAGGGFMGGNGGFLGKLFSDPIHALTNNNLTAGKYNTQLEIAAAIAAAAVTGGASLGGLGAETAGAASLDSLGGEIAGQLAGGDLALGSGLEGVSTGAVGSLGSAGLTAAQEAAMNSVGSNINDSLARGNLGADETANGTADYTASGGTGVSSSPLPTISDGSGALSSLKDAYGTAKTVLGGLSTIKNLNNLLNPSTSNSGSSSNSGPTTPGVANSSTIGGLSQAITPATISTPTYHDWQQYIAPGT
jgi:hypothetical protein